MTLDEVMRTLARGLCSRKQAKDKGCALCLPSYEALDQVAAWHAELEALRLPAGEAAHV